MVLAIGHFFNINIDNWSIGLAEAELRAFLTQDVTSLFFGGANDADTQQTQFETTRIYLGTKSVNVRLHMVAICRRCEQHYGSRNITTSQVNNNSVQSPISDNGMNLLFVFDTIRY